MDQLLGKLQKDFSGLVFAPGDVFSWSPTSKTIFYATADENEPLSCWSLLHELAHAALEHTTYSSDLELVRLEAAAWDKALELGKRYGQTIDPDHIQDCLDTYRDWLHHRSACPACTTTSFQVDERKYRCHNCDTTWTVSKTKLCRPYRRLVHLPQV